MLLIDIFEATFDTDEILDYIYDDAFDNYFKKIQRWKSGKEVGNSIKLTTKVFNPEKILKDIKDPFIKKSMEKNPVKIMTGTNYRGSFYDPANKLISISFNESLYELADNSLYSGKSYNEMLTKIPHEYHDNAENEFNGNKVKGTIAHEISHWLDDTNNKFHITKMLNIVAGEVLQSKQKGVNRREADAYMTDYEINAQTHALKELKRSVGQETWDKLTFNDLYKLDSSLRTNRERIGKISKEALSRFVKLTLQRMHRENLLGKNMTGRIAL